MSKDKQGPAMNLIHSKEKPEEPIGEEGENMVDIPEEVFQAVASEEYKRIMERLSNIESLLIKLVGK